MINFLTVLPGPINRFLQVAEPPLRSRVRVTRYRDLSKFKAVDQGTYIFADVDRLDSHQLASACASWEDLCRAQGPDRLLNNPSTLVHRHDLLGFLHREGVNEFRSYRNTQLPSRLRYPVLVRHERLHKGSLTPLLHTRDALEGWLSRLTVHCLLLGIDPARLLVVEYLDTADVHGVYRKYSAFRVGDRVVPRHVFFSRSWEVKLPDLVDDALVREEQTYLGDNPHEAWLDDVFRAANVEYGRIDYGFYQGRPQVWEINVNPVIIPKDAFDGGPRQEMHRHFARELQGALQAIDDQPASDRAAPVRLSGPSQPPLRRDLIISTLRRTLQRQRVQRLATSLLDAVPPGLVTAVGSWVRRRRR